MTDNPDCLPLDDPDGFQMPPALPGFWRELAATAIALPRLLAGRLRRLRD